jgi:hypothetical protein
VYVKPLRNGLLQINKGTTTYKKNILGVDLLKKWIIKYKEKMQVQQLTFQGHIKT